MVVIGLLLLAAAVTAGVEFGLSNLGDVGFEVFGTSFTAPLATVFILGALTMAVATLGTFLVTGAFQRRLHHRYEGKRRLAREETDTKLTEYDRTTADLVEENDRLRAELNEERRAAATLGGVAVPPGAGNVAYGDQVSDAVRSDTIAETGRFEPYPVSPVDEVRPATIDNTKYDDSQYLTETGEQKAGVIGRFRDRR
jgi:multisubunit Na+/H+ antiporter MnhC subunit